MSYLIVSPHLDDAVLSCGQLMAAHPGCTVLTVFAGYHRTGSEIVTDYDTQSGWPNADAAIMGRRLEDKRACTVLDAETVHLDGLDQQYGHRFPDTDLRDILDAERKRVVFPFGIGHEDHVAVSRFCMRWAAAAGRDTLVYEELPGRVLWPPPTVYPPEHLSNRGTLRFQVRDSLVAGPLALKQAAVACYRSQAWALERQTTGLHACFVPERYWRLSWE